MSSWKGLAQPFVDLALADGLGHRSEVLEHGVDVRAAHAGEFHLVGIEGFLCGAVALGLGEHRWVESPTEADEVDRTLAAVAAFHRAEAQGEITIERVLDAPVRLALPVVHRECAEICHVLLAQVHGSLEEGEAGAHDLAHRLLHLVHVGAGLGDHLVTLLRHITHDEGGFTILLDIGAIELVHRLALEVIEAHQIGIIPG